MFAARRTVRAARILTPLAPIGEKATVRRFGFQSDGDIVPVEVVAAVTAQLVPGSGTVALYGTSRQFLGACLRDPDGHKVEAAIVPGTS